MEMLAISFFVIAIVYITFIAVSSLIKILNTAYQRKEISKRNYKLSKISFVIIGISIAVILPFVSIKSLSFIM